MLNKRFMYYLAIAIAIISLSFMLRLERINTEWYCDEYLYEKLSRFIFYGHLASSSSHYDIYASHNATLVWGTEVEIVEPWFDHPPLFSVLDILFWFIRMPRLLPIFLGALSTLLIIYLMRKNMYESLLSGLIFSLFPFAIQLNSMLFLDNGSSFFFLLTIALTSRHEEKRSSWLLLLAGVSASLSVLCKEVGVYSILYILLYLVSLRKPLKDYKALVLALGIASVYPISGLIINKNLFLAVVTNEVNMANTTVFSPNSYKGLLNTSVHEFTYDANGFKMGDVSPLLLLAWVSLGFFLNSQNNKIVKLGAISFILTLVIMKYCWFQSWISMYPFFAIALAYSVKKILGYFADKLVKV